MKAVHILAGILSLLAGFTALYAAKGDWLHRKAGRIFSWAMLVMTALGALMAMSTHPNRGTIVAGLLSFYLVATGLLTVIRPLDQQRRPLLGLACLATAVTVTGWLFGFMAAGSPDGKLDQLPAGAIFMFASIGTLGLIGDARLLRRGSIDGVQRLHRHLWRMGFALWVATTSSFLGQARQLPDWFREEKLHFVPVLLVTFTLVYWLVRIRVLKRMPRKAPPAARRAVEPTWSGTGP